MVPSPEGPTTPLHFLDDSTLGNRRNSGKCFLSGVIQAHFCRFSPTASSKGMYRSPMISPPSLSARWREKTGETCAACGCGNGGGWRNRKSAVVSPGKAGEGPRRKDAQGGPCLPRNTCAGDHATWRRNRWVAGGASLAERSLFFAA